MATVDEDMVASFERAKHAMNSFHLYLAEYHAACLAMNWKNADQARTGIIGSIESFMDHVAAAHKRMETAIRSG